jgi:hypothetical protein
MKESLITGVTSGAATGAITGSMSGGHNKGKGAATGALIGAAVGGLASYIIHGTLEKRDTKIRKRTLLNLDKFSVSRPSAKNSNAVQDFKISAPDVDKDCFDWEIKGDKLVQQHCVWTIKGNSFWSPESK